jgi:membrane-bound serine protease (ClpP class)
MKKVRSLLVFLLLGLFFIHPIPTAAASPAALVMTISGPISPATQEYLKRSLQVAEQQDAQLLILQLNTPGGDIASMTNMAIAIRASKVPVIVYVSPRGGMAASAGSVITLSAHASAMAPQTIIGAASPVGSGGQDLGATEQSKITNAMIALVTTYSEPRGTEAVTLAKDMIQNAKAVSATEALQAHLVDFIASDVPDLLRQLDGFTVQMSSGPLTLHTAGAIEQPLKMSFIEQLLQFLIDPNIVFLELAIGVQALLIEITHPGAWVPAFFGVVCLSLAAYGLGFLPVNWFGLIFVVMAFVLFILDIKTPTHGALTIAGAVSFIVGALVLFNSPMTPKFQRVSLPLVIFMGTFIASIFAVILGYALRAQRRPIVFGQESLGGRTGFATMDIDPTGQVLTGSELWTADLAEGAEKIKKGDPIEVVKAEGLRLKVRRKP